MAERPGVVVGATCYKDSKKIGDDVDFTIPAVEFTTMEIPALGPINVPIYSSIEDLEMTITRNGTGNNFAKYIVPGKNSLELRWVEDYIDANGNVCHRGNKLFVTCYPKTLPELAVTKGEMTERSHTYTVTRMQLKVSGTEIFLIDKIAGVCKIGGKDQLSAINKLL